MDDDNIRILIVDDTVKNIQVLGSFLRTKGYQLNIAQNGKLALSIVEKTPPDLILLDIMMPELDGFETCKQLKENPATAEIPIIFLTARSETEDLIKGLNLGAVDYVTKPFKSAEVIARIETHLHILRLRKKLELRNKEILAMNDKLIDSERARAKMTRFIIQDMQSPISGVIGYVDLALKKCEDIGDTKLNWYMSMAKASVQKMNEMISTLSYVNRFESGKISLNVATTNLVEIVNRAIEEVSASGEELGIHFEHTNDEMAVEVDRDLLARVIVNLLDHLIRTNPDKKAIRIRCEEKPRFVEVEVVDTAYRPSEQEAGERGSGPDGVRDESKHYSSSLGLTFCKLTVEAHGGAIESVSSPGMPKTYRIRLNRVWEDA